MARVVAFTATGGGNFFYIPINTAGGNSTVVADNSTTTATFNFSDNTLLSSTAIYIPGNNLFNQVVLETAAGVFEYADRTFWWGERNKVQNFLNMGFEGGVSGGSPLGWTAGTGGVTVPSIESGLAWQVTGDGTSSQRGLLQQPAYQDSFGVAILQPSTSYTFRCWAEASQTSMTGSIVATLTSASTSFTSTATITASQIALTGTFAQAAFSLNTPSTIPSDLLLSVYTTNTNNGATLTLDELEIFPTAQPFLDSQLRVSYAINPESFDGVSGVIRVGTNNGQAIRQLFSLRDNLYIVKSGSMYVTSDNGTGEPSTWIVNQVSDRIGAVSNRAVDVGEDWAVIASRGGLYMFNGGEPFKISQEIQTLWDSINWQYANTIWVKNDSLSRRIYVGAPLGTAASPNMLLVLDYRELNTSSDVGNSPPIHISFTGKMIASDLSRKWTKWNVQANCGATITRPNNKTQFVLGSGNGLGLTTGYGNAYYLDSAKFTDDDYGQVNSYYTTYFFINHDAEQQLGVGSHRKLFTYLTQFISGVGKVSITPFAETLTNPWKATPAYTLSTTSNHDSEWGLNINAERTAFKTQASPVVGPNLIFDSDGVISTWTASNGLTFNSTAGAVRGGGWQITGTGAASGFLFAVSRVITVTPGATYTFSAYIDATHATTSSAFWAVQDPTLTTGYASFVQTAGISGRIAQTFTVPSGVTQVVVICDTGNVVVTNGGLLTFSNPQLELGSTATAYTPQNLDNFFNLNKMVVTLRQDPWMPVRGAI